MRRSDERVLRSDEFFEAFFDTKADNESWELGVGNLPFPRVTDYSASAACCSGGC